jgi:hypothetical protein
MPFNGIDLCVEVEGETDVYTALRGLFTAEKDISVELRHLGASSYLIWLDDKLVAEGPARFVCSSPEYQRKRILVPAGPHVLSVLVQSDGVETRLVPKTPPFLFIEMIHGGRPVSVQWRRNMLRGYERRGFRINPQLGWAEHCDERRNLGKWRTVGYDDQGWSDVRTVGIPMPNPLPANLGEIRRIPVPMTIVAEGSLADAAMVGEPTPPERFFHRGLEGSDGVWRRYDLERVRLGRPMIELSVPDGARLEIAYSEALEEGRVHPVIPLSEGPSCNLDRYIAVEGQHTYMPVSPRGGRFIEVHVLAPPESVRFLGQVFLERTYHAEPEGQFQSSDEQLNRIWRVGIETFRACTEEAVTDNPTRERGQWIGDAASVGMEVSSVGFFDQRPLRRALIQAAQCAREDGLVAGLCPGHPTYVSTYAAQWMSACVRYWELTGDGSLLRELWQAAERNVAAFEAKIGDEGLSSDLAWGFVDWGYEPNDERSDMATNLFLIIGLKAMVRWSRALAAHSSEMKFSYLANKLAANARHWIALRTSEEIGFHRAVLGLRAGLFEQNRQTDTLGFLQRHWQQCYPYHQEAPRLGSPADKGSHFITPYFSHFALDSLLAGGREEFVFEQYRRCWGWALSEGLTTWPEVFDLGWSHCHQWSSCPTWQLSRYVLGLHPRFDISPGTFQFAIRPASLTSATGYLPLPDGFAGVKVQWIRRSYGLYYRVDAPMEITVMGTPSGDLTGTRIETKVPMMMF